MLTTILYIILAILILTAIYVLVRTIIFQRSQGAVEKIEGIVVDQQWSPSTWQPCAVRPFPWTKKEPRTHKAFKQLHKMLDETYPLVHQKLKRKWSMVTACSTPGREPVPNWRRSW